MSLTVETDSYISQADAEAYIATFGLASLSDPEPLLKRATLSLDRIYAGRFIGQKRISTQPLAWPRYLDSGGGPASDFYQTGDAVLITPYSANTDAVGDVRDFTVIPVEVAHATVELALMLDAGINVLAQPDAVLTKESIEVDVIKQTREFAAAYAARPLYAISTILRPVLAPESAMRLVRG